MGKVEELSGKINQAIDEVRDDLTSPETKEKVHKLAYDTGEWIGHASNVVGSAVNGFIDDLSKGFENGKKK
ncbi:MAG TPA: hypothetical protein DDX91_01450 [Ruminococcaceae bacterium]|nr:hypothetical protein [Oscillospiraceae bacterium]